MFGTIMDGEMRLNEAGRMVERWWLELNNKFPNVRTDAYVVMPNHFHGIVMIVDARDVGADLRVRPGDGDVHAGAHTLGAHTQVCPYIIPTCGAGTYNGRTHRCAPTSSRYTGATFNIYGICYKKAANSSGFGGSQIKNDARDIGLLRSQPDNHTA